MIRVAIVSACVQGIVLAKCEWRVRVRILHGDNHG